MDGCHVTEATWFNAKRRLPRNNRDVLIQYVHWKNTSVYEIRFAQAKFDRPSFRWQVDSHEFYPSLDIVTQWAEIDSKRGMFSPDLFPLSIDKIEYLENK